jgi:hypothetical protein
MSKTLWLFGPEDSIRKLAIRVIDNKVYRIINMLLIIVALVRINLFNPLLDPDS